MVISTNGSSNGTKTNSVLGSPSLEAAVRPDRAKKQGHDALLHPPAADNEKLMQAVHTMLAELGEDPEREGLLKTPKGRGRR